MRKLLACFTLVAVINFSGFAQAVPQRSPETGSGRLVSGVVVTNKNEVVPSVTVHVLTDSAEGRAISDGHGSFSLSAPPGRLILKFEGKNIVPQQRTLGANDKSDNLRIEIEYVVPPVHDSMVIEASALDPGIDRRNDSVYK